MYYPFGSTKMVRNDLTCCPEMVRKDWMCFTEIYPCPTCCLFLEKLNEIGDMFPDEKTGLIACCERKPVVYSDKREYIEEQRRCSDQWDEMDSCVPWHSFLLSIWYTNTELFGMVTRLSRSDPTSTLANFWIDSYLFHLPGVEKRSPKMISSELVLHHPLYRGVYGRSDGKRYAIGDTISVDFIMSSSADVHTAMGFGDGEVVVFSGVKSSHVIALHVDACGKWNEEEFLIVGKFKVLVSDLSTKDADGEFHSGKVFVHVNVIENTEACNYSL